MNRSWLLACALGACLALSAQAATVTMDAAQARRIGLRVVPAVPVSDAPLATLPGVVVPRPQGRVAVSAPFSGIVRQSLVIEGQSVRRGQRLAVVQSREVLQTGAELARARARLAVARAAAARTSTLAKEGIIAGARAEQATADLREVEVEINEKLRILRLAGADAASGTYTLVASVAGVVVQANAQTGGQIVTRRRVAEHHVGTAVDQLADPVWRAVDRADVDAPAGDRHADGIGASGGEPGR